jgi:hypothetical protein
MMWEEDRELVKVLPVRFAMIVVKYCTPEGAWVTQMGSYVFLAPPPMQYFRYMPDGNRQVITL